MDTLFQRFPSRAKISNSLEDLLSSLFPFGRPEDSKLNRESPADLFLMFFCRAYDRTARKLKGHPHYEVPFRPLFLSKHQNQMSKCQEGSRTDCCHWCAEVKTFLDLNFLHFSHNARTVNVHWEWKQASLRDEEC